MRAVRSHLKTSAISLCFFTIFRGGILIPPVLLLVSLVLGPLATSASATAIARFGISLSGLIASCLRLLFSRRFPIGASSSG